MSESLGSSETKMSGSPWLCPFLVSGGNLTDPTRVVTWGFVALGSLLGRPSSVFRILVAVRLLRPSKEIHRAPSPGTERRAT